MTARSCMLKDQRATGVTGEQFSAPPHPYLGWPHDHTSMYGMLMVEERRWTSFSTRLDFRMSDLCRTISACLVMLINWVGRWPGNLCLSFGCDA